MDADREYSFCDRDFFELQRSGIQCDLFEKSHAEFSDSSSTSESVSLPTTPEKSVLGEFSRGNKSIRGKQCDIKKTFKSKKQLMSRSERKRSQHSSVSETSSEEGYYTSTSPDVHPLKDNAGLLGEFNKHSKLPPIAHHDEAIEKSNDSEEEGQEDEQQVLWNNHSEAPKVELKKSHKSTKALASDFKTVEPLGLSPRFVFQSKCSNKEPTDTYIASSRQWPPPKSPAYAKRPQFKGLATLAGSMNNLAAIPEMDQELIQMRPISRRQQQSMGGSWDNVSALIQSDSFQVRPTKKKGKPHYVAPMDLFPRLKALSNSDRGQSFCREYSKDNDVDMFKELDVPKSKQHLCRENSTLSEASLTSRRKKGVRH